MKKFQACILSFLLTNLSMQALEQNQRPNPNERQQQILTMDLHSHSIKQLMKIEPKDIAQEQYELGNKNKLVKEIYLKNGSYVKTTFNKANNQPIETRYYETAENALQQECYVNTKLFIHHDNGITNIHALNCDSGKIESSQLKPFFATTLNRLEPQKEYFLDTSSLTIKQKRHVPSFVQQDELLENHVTDCEKLIERIKKAYEEGNVIDIIEKNADEVL